MQDIAGCQGGQVERVAQPALDAAVVPLVRERLLSPTAAICSDLQPGQLRAASGVAPAGADVDSNDALEKLIKIAAKVVRHAKAVTIKLAEVAVPRALFAAILGRIGRLRAAPSPG